MDYKSQNPVDPEKIHDRSRASGFDLLKTLVALGTASVGAFFFALTRRLEPYLWPAEKWTLLAAICFMVAAVGAGLAAWAADARFYKDWADALREKQGSSWDRRKQAKKWRQRLVVVLAVCFFCGVVAAGTFGVLRVLRVADCPLQADAPQTSRR